jgi:hypothetical protein
MSTEVQMVPPTDPSRPAADLLVPEGTRLLHVGPPKTGTTTVQTAFFTAREAIRAQGVRYAGKRSFSAAAYRSVLARGTYRNHGAPPPPRVWQNLLKEVRTAPESRVVLSSEYLAGARPAEIGRIVSDLDPARVHVVFTLRSLSRLLPSAWQQDLRNGTTTSYEAWLHEVLDADRPRRMPFWHPHRHDEAVARWADAVGPEHVTVIAVDERDHEFSLRVFEQLVGLRSGTLVGVPELANRSLTLYEAEAMRALNVAFAERGVGKAQQSTIGHAGVSYELRTRPIGPDEPRIETPQWALDRAGEIAREMAAGIAASGVRIVGDLDSLTAVPTSRIEGDLQPVTMVPTELGALMVTGTLTAIGVIPRKKSDPRPRLSVGSLDFAGIPTRRLAMTLMHRAWRKVPLRRR